ncbi:Bifunctional indole-3-glycerol phosphate synthase/phosphoribosylanthranilate isomerase, partial [human gut metagenome]
MILDKIIEATKIRVAQEKQVESPEAVKAAALTLGSLIGRGSGESFQLGFHGPGFVVVQP